MRRHLPALAVALLAAVPAVAQDVEVSRTTKSWYLGETAALAVDLSIGGVTIEGSDRHDLEAELRLSCSRADLEACTRRARRIHLAPRVHGPVFEVRLKGTPRGRVQGLSAELVLRVPARLPLEVDLRAGDVTVAGMTSDLEVDVGAGNVTVRYPQRLVREVKVAVGVGEADLWLPEAHVQGSGFPRSLRWSGSGTARVEVDAGTGDVDVDLR